MSGIISSFIIDPVVRHARRFSSQGSSSKPQHAAALSHANADAAADASARVQTTNITQHPNAIAEEDNPRSLLTHATIDRFVPLLADGNAAANHRRRRTDTVTQRPLEETYEGILFTDGAVQSVIEEPHDSLYHETGDVSVNGDDILRLTSTPLASNLDTSTIVLEDTDMAPSMSAHTRGARTSSARDITRPQMSLREDSPSKAVRSLPADDGMRLLRQRIHQIRSLKTSQDEQARRMHDLMTEEWHARQMALRPQSPASISSQDRTFIPSSPMSTITAPTSPESLAYIPIPPIDPSNPFNTHPEDLQPSYRPLPDPDAAHADECHDASPTSEPPQRILGCKHYKRNVKIQCHDCRDWHSCRHCHDATVKTHHLNRKATENMLCMLCWTPQAAGQDCKECGERAAWYYCDICKLWDDDASKSIYHCPDCGICRRGEGLGKDFVHCKKCNVCISIAHYGTHTCIENATDSNCPLCLDYMFTSPLEIVAMPCGHYLHHHCYTSLMLSTYQCPICKRSAVNMETQWRKLEEEIRNQPMPREWCDVKVEVKCNDCAGVSVGGFHWLGVKCGRCDGFNTSQVRMLAAEEVRRDVVEFAEQRRERRAEMGREREPFRRTFTAPVTVRPYFLDDDDDYLSAGARPRSMRVSDGFQSPFTLPDLPRLPEFSGRLPNLPEFSGRIPIGLPNMPYMPSYMPSMPGINFPFDMWDRVGRSLSPIRHYFDDQIADGVPRQFFLPEGVRTSLEGEDGRVWRVDEDWLIEESSEEDSDEEEDDSEEEDYEDSDDSDEEMTDIGLDDDDDDDDEQDQGSDRLDIELTGHR